MAEEKKVTERYELVQIPTQTDIAFRDTEADEDTSVLTQHEVQVRTLNLLEKVAKNLGVK